MTTKAVNGFQGLAGLIGITLGVIPIMQFLITGASGSIWKVVLADTTGTSGWLGPFAVVLAAVLVIVVLERRKT